MSEEIMNVTPINVKPVEVIDEQNVSHVNVEQNSQLEQVIHNTEKTNNQSNLGNATLQKEIQTSSLKEMEETDNSNEMKIKAIAIAHDFIASDDFNKIITGELKLDGSNPNFSELFKKLSSDSRSLKMKESEVESWQEKINKTSKALNVQESGVLDDTELKELIQETSRSVESYRSEKEQEEELKKTSLIMKPLVFGKHLTLNFVDKVKHGIKKDNLSAAEAIKKTKEMYETYRESLQHQFNYTKAKIEMDKEKAGHNALKAKALEETLNQMELLLNGMLTKKDQALKELATLQDQVTAIQRQNSANGLDINNIPTTLKEKIYQAEVAVFGIEDQIKNLQNAKNLAAREFENAVEDASASKVQENQGKANLENINSQLIIYETNAKNQIVQWEHQINLEQSAMIQKKSLEFIGAISDTTASTAMTTVDLVRTNIEQARLLEESSERNRKMITDANKQITELYRKDEAYKNDRANVRIQNAREKMVSDDFLSAMASSNNNK